MNCVIDFNSPVPAYMQLYQSLRSSIVSGIYPYGTKIPSKRTTAAETGVSVITVEHAYDILCDEGYLNARCRSGYFVTYRSDDVLPVSPLIPHAPVSRSISPTEEVFPYSVFARTVRRVLADYGEALLCRSPNSGCLELRESISSYLARSRGIFVSSQNIVIGSGAEYLYGLVVQMLGRNRIYGVEDPSYEKIANIYRSNGVVCDFLPLGTDGIRSDALASTKATVLHVTPYNSYPSGITASASKRNEYVRWAMQRKGYVIEDDFDSEYTVSTKSEETVFSLDSQRVIYMNTFSKTVAPSVRVGYMVLPSSLMDRFCESVGDLSCTVPVLEQYLLAELINSGDFERHINRVRRKRRKELGK